MIGMTLCGVAALSLLGIGIGAIVAPGFSARQYGIVVDDARALAYLRAMGARDLVLGIVLGLLMVFGSPGMLAASVAACALVAIVDFAVVLADPRPGTAPPAVPRGLSLTLHAGGAIGLLAAAVLVALGR
jgi:hypothetical protein